VTVADALISSVKVSAALTCEPTQTVVAKVPWPDAEEVPVKAGTE